MSAIIKRYNSATGQWEAILAGEQGPQGPQGATVDVASLETRDSVIQVNVDSLEAALTTEINTTNSEITSINTRAASIESDLTSLETSLSGDISTEAGRIDAILAGANANTDTFAEVVSLINTVDTTNDQAFSGYATNTDASIDSLETLTTTLNNNDITSASFNSTTGTLTLTQNDATTITTSLDGRYCTTDTNTTYTAGTGLTLTGTSFSIQNDLRGETCLIGYSSTDYIYVQNTVIDFYLDGNLDMRLENDGDLHVDGDVIAYSTTTSDERLKNDIKPITGALDIVDSLNGVGFKWKDGNRSGNADWGVIAQEVEKILPELIKETKLPTRDPHDETLYKTVRYEGLIPFLLEAIKELNQKVIDLENRL